MTTKPDDLFSVYELARDLTPREQYTLLIWLLLDYRETTPKDEDQ